MNADLLQLQKAICDRHHAPFCASPNHLKVGISDNVKSGLLPINGLRHPLQYDTTGWYIWAGEELSKEPDFFKPLHVEHLQEWCPGVLKYLGLPPGWRFLVAGEQEDIWEDHNLLDI